MSSSPPGWAASGSARLASGAPEGAPHIKTCSGASRLSWGAPPSCQRRARFVAASRRESPRSRPAGAPDGARWVREAMRNGSEKVVGAAWEAGAQVRGRGAFPSVLTVIVTIVATVALTLVVQKTKLGKAMRAVSEDMGAARLMGINVNSTISFTFAVGSALAGIGAVLYAMAYTQASPTMGMMLGTKAFVAAVLGGIGSIPGAVVGGLLVGFAEVIVTALGLSVWKDAVVFLLLIIVLVVRPTGIFGRTMNEKV